ncbi:MAG: hypothetical protein WB239_14090, partial [Acidimicrobiia bacterium]
SWVVAAATLGMFVIANVAAAAVTDSSTPGDALYGVDRAYEWVSDTLGLTHDHTSERLEEAETLLDRSDPVGALDLVASEINDETVAMVAQSLQSSALGNDELKTMATALVTDARKMSEAARSGNEQAVRDFKALMMTLVDVPNPGRGSGNANGNPANGNANDNPGNGNPGNSNPGNSNPGHSNPGNGNANDSSGGKSNSNDGGGNPGTSGNSQGRGSHEKSGG